MNAGSMSRIEFAARLDEIKELENNPEIDWATFALLTQLYYSKYLAITQTKPRKENKRSKLYSTTPQ